EWGRPDNPRVLVCVHGLTRCAHDFDWLAQALENDCRVICPDVAGRGASDRLPDGAYDFPVYLNDMAVLLARLDVEEVTWLGTSMGGIIGMLLAAQPGTPITRLILNDIGPFIPAASITRLKSELGAAIVTRMADLAAAEACLRIINEPFGPISDDQWKRMAVYMTRPVEGGGLRWHYDPAILKSLAEGEPKDVVLWPFWEQIKCPVLLLRGETSDLLPAETAVEMTRRGPCCEAHTVPGCGHAPSLMHPEHITLVKEWLFLPVS
ncbi:MAG: alpha/beta hydrolase, partial [Rhodospirillales bacterium]|nr:alpha/beta hydrolase [Rhodospirillales bacterium]